MNITKEELMNMGFEVRSGHCHQGGHWSDHGNAVVIAHHSLPSIDSVSVNSYGDEVVSFQDKSLPKGDCLCYLGSGENEEEAWQETMEALSEYKDWRKGAVKNIEKAKSFYAV